MATGLGWLGLRPRVERGPAEATWRAANGVGCSCVETQARRPRCRGAQTSPVPSSTTWGVLAPYALWTW